MCRGLCVRWLYWCCPSCTCRVFCSPSHVLGGGRSRRHEGAGQRGHQHWRLLLDGARGVGDRAFRRRISAGRLATWLSTTAHGLARLKAEGTRPLLSLTTRFLLAFYLFSTVCFVFLLPGDEYLRPRILYTIHPISSNPSLGLHPAALQGSFIPVAFSRDSARLWSPRRSHPMRTETLT